MTELQLDEALRPFYDRPAATSLESFDNLTDTLFIPSKSSQSRVEVFQPLLTKSEHADRSAKSGTSGLERIPHSRLSDIQSDPSPSAANQTVSGIRRLENEKQIREYAEANSFQVYFVRQRNSYSPLSISSELYEVVSRVCDAPWFFSDYFLYFGDRESEIEIAPPPLRFGPIWSPKGVTKGIRTECTYCVRFVDTNNRIDVLEPSSRWSLRQTAVFCKSNVEKQESSWIFINLSHSTQKRLQNLWINSVQPGQVRPLHFHYAVYSIAIANWRPYTIALHTEIEQHAVQLLGASPDNKGPLDMSDSGERQKLLILENKILTAQLAVNATRDDVKTMHRIATESLDEESNHSHSEYITLMNGFCQQLRELEVSSLRLGQLHARLQSITNLVSSFLDLSNGFALQELAKESRRENEEMLKLNERMHELAKKNTQDAAAVTVLTILALIYLPVTVVSNFFSTSFVGTENSASHIFVTKDWWILLATSLPLTALTLYVWWIWMRIKAYSIYPWWWSDTPNNIQFLITNDTLNVFDFVLPDQNASAVDALLAAFLPELERLNITYNLIIGESATYVQSFVESYGALPYGDLCPNYPILSSRIIPRSTVLNSTANANLMDTYRSIVADGTWFVGCSFINVVDSPVRPRHPPNAVLPAWRDAIAYCNPNHPWDWEDPSANIAAKEKLVHEYFPAIEAATPGSGVYLNEMDPLYRGNWKETMYGANYDRLLQIKHAHDPHHLMYAHFAVGADEFTLDNDGRLCKAQ